MGGTTFDHYQDGTKVEHAFAEAVTQARHEHGHGGYSGTMAEKTDCVVITRTPMSSAEAYALAEKLTEADDPRISDKWGPAGAIPVITGKRTIQVQIPEGYNDEWSFRERKPSDTALALLKAKKLLKRGEKVVDLHLTSYSQVDVGYGAPQRRQKFKNGTALVTIQDALAPTERSVKVSFIHPGKVDHNNTAEWEPVVRAKTKLGENEKIIRVRIAAADGVCKTTVDSNSKVKAQVRYVIPNTKFAKWEDGFDTQAQARAAAVDIAENAPTVGWNAIEELKVIGVTLREDGTPLVTVKRETKKTLAVAEVTILKTPPRPNAQPDGWLFFGWASC